MYLLGFLLLFLLQDVKCNDNKIVNPRRQAKEREFPFLVMVKRYFRPTNFDFGYSFVGQDSRWRIECSGTLYSLKHVITVASCVQKLEAKPKSGIYNFEPEPNMAKFRIYAGTLDIYTTGDGVQMRQVAEIHYPRKVHYESQIRPDVAIMVLRQSFQATLYVTPVVYLPLDNKHKEDEKAYLPFLKGNYCVVPGWGHRNSTTRGEKNVVVSFNGSDVLYVAVVKPIEIKNCISRICVKYQHTTTKIMHFGNPCRTIPFFSWSTVFCAMANNFTDVCFFDYGSPLVCDGKVIGMLTAVNRYFGCGRGVPSYYVSMRVIYEMLDSTFKKSKGARMAIMHLMIASFLTIH